MTIAGATILVRCYPIALKKSPLLISKSCTRRRNFRVLNLQMIGCDLNGSLSIRIVVTMTAARVKCPRGVDILYNAVICFRRPGVFIFTHCKLFYDWLWEEITIFCTNDKKKTPARCQSRLYRKNFNLWVILSQERTRRQILWLVN